MFFHDILYCRLLECFQDENIRICYILDSRHIGQRRTKFKIVKNFQVMSRHQKIDMDLLFFSFIDEATKIWLDTLHRMWTLCKHLILFSPSFCHSIAYIKCAIISIVGKKCDGVSKTLTDYFETAPNPYLSTLRIMVNVSDFDHMTNSKSLAFAGLFFSFLYKICLYNMICNSYNFCNLLTWLTYKKINTM